MNRRSLFNFIRKDHVFVPEPEPEEEERESLIDRKHSRRFFFGILAGAAATVAIPDTGISLRLVRRFDPVASVSRNEFITPEQFTREYLRILQKNMVTTKYVNREFGDLFGEDGTKIGCTPNAKIPARFRNQATVIG